MAEQNNEETTVVEETATETVTEKKKPAAKKPANKNKSEDAIVSAAAEVEEESVDELLNRLIEKESAKGSIIGSMSADRKDEVPLDADATKVAVYSSRNASWGGYGSIYKGYNILSKRRADAWLSRGHVRIATPAEIAQHLR